MGAVSGIFFLESILKWLGVPVVVDLTQLAPSSLSQMTTYPRRVLHYPL